MSAALEDEEAQKKAIILMVYPKKTKLSQFDKNVSGAILSSIKGWLPVHVSAFHICHPPSFSTEIIAVLKVFLGERLRKRVQVHSGSENKVLERLSKYGMTKDTLPNEVGGNIKMNLTTWLAERKAAGK